MKSLWLMANGRWSEVIRHLFSAIRYRLSAMRSLL
jgi:hypothetical protein